MKKLAAILIFAVSGLSTYAQSDITSSVDSINIQNLLNEIKQLQGEVQDQSLKINGLYSGVKLQAAAKYNVIEHNLTTGIDAYETLHKNILALQSKQSMDRVDVFVKDLNNPNSEALGFKFSDRIVKLATDLKPKKEQVGKKLVDNVMSITQSPLASSIPLISPAVSITTSVLGLVRGASFMTNDFDQKKVSEFEKELNKYTLYYNALSAGNMGLVYNIENQQQSLYILQQKLYDQVIYFADKMNLPFRAKTANESYSTFLNDFFASVNKNVVYRKFTQLQKEHTSGNNVNHDALLRQNEYLKDANNYLTELIDLVNAYVVSYDNYINMTEYYYATILKSLDIAKSTAIAKEEDVNKKKAEFEELKTRAMDQFKVLINIQQLISKKKAVQYNSNFQ